MDKAKLASIIDSLLAETKTAVLSTVTQEGVPQIRWMTPTLLPSRPGSLFCLTSSNSLKALSIRNSNWISWMVQNRALTTIVNLQCRAFVINDPTIQQEVIDEIGRYIRVLWHLNTDPADLCVIESVIVHATYFLPMEGKKEFIDFE